MPPLRVFAAMMVFAVLTLGQAAGARAGSFDVMPVRVYLSSTTTSGLLTVRNHGAETLRFQVKAFAWTESSSGEMQRAFICLPRHTGGSQCLAERHISLH